MKIETSKEPIRLKKKAKAKMIQKDHRNTPEFLLCCLGAPGHGVHPGVWCRHTQWDCWRTNSPLVSRYQLYRASSSGWAPVSTPLPRAGSSSGLNLCKSHECCHSLCELLYVSALLCLEMLFLWCHPPPLALTILLPLLYSLLSLEGRVLIETYNLGLSRII